MQMCIHAYTFIFYPVGTGYWTHSRCAHGVHVGNMTGQILNVTGHVTAG